MSPRASNGAVKVISAGLGRKLGLGFVAYAVAENGIAFEIKPSIIVLGDDILSAPFSVNELSHSSSPAQMHAPV
jgi:hypothetical protein